MPVWLHWDKLTEADRRTVQKALTPRVDADDHVLWELNEPLPSGRALAAARRVLQKLRGFAALPAPPVAGDFRVWQLRKGNRRDLWKYAAITAKDSPVRRCLPGKNPDVRKQLAIRAVSRVDAFRVRCRRRRALWWFRLCLATVTD
jgi:hypothetical protein